MLMLTTQEHSTNLIYNRDIKMDRNSDRLSALLGHHSSLIFGGNFVQKVAMKSMFLGH